MTENKPVPQTKQEQSVAQKTLKLSMAEFTAKAVIGLRRDNYKGIHSVYSGFNEAFRAYFASDPVTWQQSKEFLDKFDIVRSRGGAMIYMAGEGPQQRKVQDTLNQILSCGQ